MLTSPGFFFKEAKLYLFVFGIVVLICKNSIDLKNKPKELSFLRRTSSLSGREQVKREDMIN